MKMWVHLFGYWHIIGTLIILDICMYSTYSKLQYDTDMLECTWRLHMLSNSDSECLILAHVHNRQCHVHKYVQYMRSTRV